MAYWTWILIGLVLLAVELLTPGGFFMLFFGGAALIVAALAAVGVLPQAAGQWAVFGIVGTVSLLALRPWVLKKTAPPEGAQVDALVSERGVVLDGLETGARGRVELRGTPWAAINQGASALAAGDRVRIVRVEGLTLHVEKEGS